jgi:2-polyprenyl-3-methyl-5-hydroxy-6-metoxy-1,4-benzoquinol methylase
MKINNDSIYSMRKNSAIVCFALLTLHGCASVPMTDINLPEQFSNTATKTILYLPDQSLIGPRNIAFLPVRLENLSNVLTAKGWEAKNLKVLVANVGDGGLALALAASGANVSILDKDDSVLERARTSATAMGLAANTRFVKGQFSDISAEQGRFDLVVMSNTLELAEDKEPIVAMLSKIVSSSGMVVLDSINRSTPSNLIYLGGFQIFPLTSFVPWGTYSSDRFTTLLDLQSLSEKHGFRLESVRGFSPRNIPSLVGALIGKKFGWVSNRELVARAQMKLEDPTKPAAVTYFAVMVKKDLP